MAGRRRPHWLLIDTFSLPQTDLLKMKFLWAALVVTLLAGMGWGLLRFLPLPLPSHLYPLPPSIPGSPFLLVFLPLERRSRSEASFNIHWL